MERVWAQIRLKFNLNIGSILNILNILDNFECWNIFYIESIFFYSDDTKLQAMRHISDSDCLKGQKALFKHGFWLKGEKKQVERMPSVIWHKASNAFGQIVAEREPVKNVLADFAR